MLIFLPFYNGVSGFIVTLSVVRRNHDDRQIDHRAVPDLGHYNFKLVDKLQGYMRQLNVLDANSAVGG
jgi:hypothetical protein